MGYLDEDPSVVVPPAQPSIGALYAAKAPPQAFVPPPEDSIAAQVGSRLGNVSALASTVNPMGMMLAHGIGTAAGNSYLRGQETRDPVFQRDEVQQLQPMNTPLVDVQAAPTLAQTAPQYRMSAGMGPGGGIGEGSGMSSGRTDMANAEKAVLAGMGKEKEARGNLTVAQADKNDLASDLEGADAANERVVYENQQQIYDDANKNVDNFFQTNARMANEIATAKIDSNRLFKNMDTAGSITMGIGAVLSGMMSGLRGGGPNEFMQSVDRLVDRDVADQQSAIEGKKSGLAARQSMYNQLLQQTGDRHLAAMQLKSLQLQAIKQKTAAQIKAAGTPEILQQGNEHLAVLDQNIGKVQEAMAQRKIGLEQAAAAQKAAAANNVLAMQMKLAEEARKNDELSIKKGELQVKQAEAGLLPGVGAGGPLAGVPKDLRNEAAKELQAHAAAEKGISGIQNSFKKWEDTSILSPNQLAATKATIANELKATLGPGLSSDKDYDTYIAPNLPAYGDSAATLAHKQANMAALVRGKVATPILDQTQPGWRMPATVKVKK
jgi:hypothetical protein